jgi:NADP-dependent aldehyde dehydrogenase
VAGGDTISALAAGNPVVVKAHPAHPGASEIAARAIVAAVGSCGLPGGVLSLLQGRGNDVGLSLVNHPAAKAVGFTGSLQGGRALFDAAAARPEPIPVYAEMGSTNPVFVLPGASADTVARGLVQSVILGVGQFCTKPGLVFGVKSDNWTALQQLTARLAAETKPGVMLTAAIASRFSTGVHQVKKTHGVSVLAEAGAFVAATDAAAFRGNPLLHEEIFGPAVIFVTCDSAEELAAAALDLPGQLTAAIHGTTTDLAANPGLLSNLQQKAGRLIFNGFPTGVEVAPAMHHGGPYPATTSALSTSVGTAAIVRFARPVCFQNFPDAALPPQLRDRNEGKIWRMLDGEWTKDEL